jgi:hypothetical protein
LIVPAVWLSLAIIVKRRGVFATEDRWIFLSGMVTAIAIAYYTLGLAGQAASWP